MRLAVLAFTASCVACAGSQLSTGPADPDNPGSCFVTHPVGGVIPIPVHRVDALYPREARQSGVTGEVILQGSIGQRGEIVDAQVVDSKPPGVFDETALRAFSQWRYCPPTPELPYPDTFKTRLRFAR